MPEGRASLKAITIQEHNQEHIQEHNLEHNREHNHPMSEDIVKRMEGVNDPADWSPCSGCFFYKHLDDINFVLNSSSTCQEKFKEQQFSKSSTLGIDTNFDIL